MTYVTGSEILDGLLTVAVLGVPFFCIAQGFRWYHRSEWPNLSWVDYWGEAGAVEVALVVAASVVFWAWLC